jgi:membrane fusion protein, multidrug efflux system
MLKEGNGMRWVAVILAVAGFIAAVSYWMYARSHEWTDDAMIDAHIVSISPKIAGQVLRVLVDDNRQVKKGDLLVEIDPVDFQVRLDQSRAEMAAAQAEAKRTVTDEIRYKQLFEKGQVSRQVYDKSVADADVAKAKATLAEKKVAAAELDLSYTKITSPESGRVAKRAVELRSFVQVGQPLMAIIPVEVWVTAKFKETQLEQIRPGQSVTIKVDTYPGRSFRGHVDSVQAGAEARFSLLPPENATGNFVKVVQRIPVKIVFDEKTDGYLLAPGMSVVPVVQVR